jgi:hypothetical protein
VNSTYILGEIIHFFSNELFCLIGSHFLFWKVIFYIHLNTSLCYLFFYFYLISIVNCAAVVAMNIYNVGVCYCFLWEIFHYENEHLLHLHSPLPLQFQVLFRQLYADIWIHFTFQIIVIYFRNC